MALSMNGCILEKDVTLVEKVDSVMKTRFSCRHYLPKPVPRRALEEIVDAARFSPSGNNMQPWEKVYCITGETLKIITDEMTKANCLNPNPHTSEYDYYPPGPLPSIYATRRQEFGKLHYGALNIAREDTEGRAKASSRNYVFYGAPVAFIFTIHRDLTQGSWLDVGCFIQSMILASRVRGLETVAQESVSRYHQIFRNHLPISDDEMVAVGLAMGYPDLEQVARFCVRQPKRDISDIVEFHGTDH